MASPAENLIQLFGFHRAQGGCEDDYVWSENVAEGWNTVSSIVFVLPFLVCRSLEPKTRRDEFVSVGFILACLVCLGSGLYHLKLLQIFRTMDHLSCLLLCLANTENVMCLQKHSFPVRRYLLTVCLSLALIVSTASNAFIMSLFVLSLGLYNVHLYVQANLWRENAKLRLYHVLGQLSFLVAFLGFLLDDNCRIGFPSHLLWHVFMAVCIFCSYSFCAVVRKTCREDFADIVVDGAVGVRATTRPLATTHKRRCPVIGNMSLLISKLSVIVEPAINLVVWMGDRGVSSILLPFRMADSRVGVSKKIDSDSSEEGDCSPESGCTPWCEAHVSDCASGQVRSRPRPAL